VCIAAVETLSFAQGGSKPRVARPRLNNPPVAFGKPCRLLSVTPFQPHYDGTPENNVWVGYCYSAK
jgi:hypothetical protein